ncbi:MAG: response regulator transcription factor [Limnohabitans sp.]|nr:response regulator transcription factor [Limnohabitans sp.]
MRIILADDHPFTLDGTKVFVENLGHYVEGSTNNGVSALLLIESKSPDLAILDINMPGMDGLEVLQQVYEKKMKTKIVLLTMHKEISIYNKANEYNVYGYILKEFAHSELRECLIEIEKGNKYVSKDLLESLIINDFENNDFITVLSSSEQKIVKLIGQQFTTKEISSMLFLSEKTIERHRTSIIGKLKLPKEKNALLKWAIQNVNRIK